MPYLEQAGFGSAALIQTFDLRYDLLSALVERWRPETHTFHFPCGECTVTLEDVALQLGLPINGSPVTGVTSFTDLTALCYQLIGDSPNDDDWGTAVLGVLYRELFRTTNPSVVDMGGCLTLLQSWALYRIPF
ncbi:hypothetical protein Gotur_029582, partial [Gossypium turneri]